MTNVSLTCCCTSVLLMLGCSGGGPGQGTGTAGTIGSGGVASGSAGTTGAAAGTSGGAGTSGATGSAGSVGGTSAGGQGGDSVCDGFSVPADHPTAATAYETTADTVTDRATGLMWQRNVTTSDGYHTGFLGGCRNPQLAGFSDWRPPTALELATIVDLAAHDPAIDATTFPGTPIGFFGTSTGVFDHASGNNNWTVDLGTGMTMNGTPTNIFVRCVRRAAPAICYAGPRFQRATSPNGVETVVDARTTLTWQRGVAPAPVTWENAKPYCASLGGSFRLPSAKELLSLVDWTARKAIDTSAFPAPGTPYEDFWTETAYPRDPSYAVTVSFGDATYTGTRAALTTEAHPVRCVM